MPSAARSYLSYEDFERDELRLDAVHVSVDEMFDDGFVAELDFDEAGGGRKRRGKGEDDDEE